MSFWWNFVHNLKGINPYLEGMENPICNKMSGQYELRVGFFVTYFAVNYGSHLFYLIKTIF
jgi:hypothetical protein